MTTKVKALYDGALSNNVFLRMIAVSNGDKAPNRLSSDLEKHIFAATYYGWLVGMYDINWESNI